jgi:hypothetical protein
LPVPTYELFSSTERLGRMAMERMLAGLSTWRYPVGVGAGRAAHRTDRHPSMLATNCCCSFTMFPGHVEQRRAGFRQHDRSGRPSESDPVPPAQLSGEGAPGLAAAPLGEPDHQQREPAEQDVGADAGLEPMQHRAQLDGRLHIEEAAFGLEQVPVAERDVLGRQVRIRGGQQLLAVQLRLSGDLGAVHHQPPGQGVAQSAEGVCSPSAHSVLTCAFSSRSAACSAVRRAAAVIVVAARRVRVCSRARARAVVSRSSSAVILAMAASRASVVAFGLLKVVTDDPPHSRCRVQLHLLHPQLSQTCW